ncbi:MAG: pitrilysin family protein [Eubacteriales bacterium]|nr:pitrilysin family protein [Eubacteriales bacterium]
MVKVIELNCGITLVTEQTDYVRSAALGIWVKSGSIYENDNNNGISHFIEHMMFKGTEKRTAKEIAEDMDKIGASSNAMTGKEATCYYVKTVSSHIYEAADILLDMVLNSTFNPDEIDKERQVILEEIKMVKDSPDDDVYDTISELVNSCNPLGRTILGSPESLAGVNREVMVSYYKERYAREGIVVTVAGNFDEDKIIRAFEDKMQTLNLKLPEDKLLFKPYKKSFNVKKKDIEQTHLCLACPTVSYSDELYYAFGLANNILGGSMSSRLFQSIREQKGLAYSVCSMNSFSSFSGSLSIYAGIAHDKLKDTICEIKNELTKFAEHGVTEKELSMAKEQFNSSYIFSLENTTTRMISLGRFQLLMNKVFDVDEMIEHYNAVSRNDIFKAAELIADINNYCGAAVSKQEFDFEELIGNANKN